MSFANLARLKFLFYGLLFLSGASHQLTAAPCDGLGTLFQPSAGGKLIRKVKETSIAICCMLIYVADSKVDVISKAHVELRIAAKSMKLLPVCGSRYADVVLEGEFVLCLVADQAMGSAGLAVRLVA